MRTVIAILFVLFCRQGFSQDWHRAGEPLRLPPSIGHMYASVGSLNKFDTVSCIYTTTASRTPRKGFKFVYILHGFYTDTATTATVFFDDDLHRVYNVKKFYFD